MKKLELKDISSPAEYAEFRSSMRSRIMKIKEERRISVGPYLSFFFENRDTMLYQVLEMVRAENIRDENKVRHEIETYNRLIPEVGELRATLMIEIEDTIERAVKLRELKGLQEHIYLVVNSQDKIPAQFDEKQIGDEKLSAVQYIRFRPEEEKNRAILKEAKSLEIETTHPACSYRQPFTKIQIAALKKDGLIQYG